MWDTLRLSPPLAGQICLIVPPSVGGVGPLFDQMLDSGSTTRGVSQTCHHMWDTLRLSPPLAGQICLIVPPSVGGVGPLFDHMLGSGSTTRGVSQTCHPNHMWDAMDYLQSLINLPFMDASVRTGEPSNTCGIPPSSLGLFVLLPAGPHHYLHTTNYL